MKVLNLDQGFVPFRGRDNVDFTSSTFPSSFEHHIKLPKGIDGDVLITARISSDADMSKVFLVKNALDRMDDVSTVSLFIPFLPYARQDRVMDEGEAFSLEVIAGHINACNFKKVYFFDVHSDVACALIKRSISIPNHAFVEEVLFDKTDYFIVCPDAGAYKKIDKLVEYLNKSKHCGYVNEIISCTKMRDTTNGRIKHFRVDASDLQGKDCYIVDDICDGGATFMLLSAELKKKNAGNVYLVVSHGIFSRGFDDLLCNIDGVYTTNSFIARYTSTACETTSLSTESLMSML